MLVWVDVPHGVEQDVNEVKIIIKEIFFNNIGLTCNFAELISKE
jgi:hypothetical protein